MLRRGPGALIVTVVMVLAGVLPAYAVRTTAYSDWDPLTGSSNNYTTTLLSPAKGFPAAEVASDSRSGSVGVQSGASVWFGAATPVGAKYGSSQNRPYLNLRPRADTPTTPSTTTYTFDTPTPATGWAFVLGDIDADAVTISAKDAAGGPVSAAQLGFAGGFNLCEFGFPRPSGCSASIGDSPVWDPATRTLRGNPTAADTFGATGWFEPTVALSTLTFSFTRRSGFPVYQTWFTSVARTISGTVDDVSTDGDSCPVEGITVRLVGPAGEQLETTLTDATGAYSFGQYATQDGYTVSIEPPPTCAVVGARSRSVSTAVDDATAAFEVREIIPLPVTGQVTADGVPLAGVPVTLHLPGGGTKTTTTGADGGYLFDDNDIGDGYFVTIEIPEGYTGADQRPPFDLDDAPITGQDFVLSANPDVSGVVTGGGGGLGGVTVTLTPSGGGAALTTVTAGDGSYAFERVPPGTYDITIDTPAGYSPAPALEDVVVDDVDVTDQHFNLARPGALGGTVHLDSSTGAGLDGVTIEISGPGGDRTITTDAEGNYFLDSLPAGTYEVRLVVPDGFEGVGSLVRSVTITEDGELRSGQDFVVTRTTTTSPSPSPSATTGPSGPASPTAAPTGTSPGGDLPNTGTGVTLPLVLLGVGLLSLGVLLVGATSIGRRREH